MDYEKIGFKSGLEIHQQLDTHKLFCNCPSVLRSDDALKTINRKLHAVAGESGEIDTAAKHEASLDREFSYEVYDTTCLIELDEAPPRLVNQEALKIVLQVALLLNCQILPVTQVMRKTVIDGSNTSGFQRTVLIAQNGYVETSSGKVGIDSVVLEEDSARLVNKDDKKSIYRLDRLGIPLIEIATSPDMKTPEQVKEVALFIGDVLRACKVKRGIGTIRQDVNVSIKNHERVEIKGFQDPKMFVPTIDKEIERQQKNSKSKSEVRKANADGTTSFLRPMPGSARMYPETDLPLLEVKKELVNEIKSNLPKLRKDIKSELKAKGLNEEMITLIVKNNKLEDFLELSHLNKDNNLIAKSLVLWPKDFAKKLGLKLETIEKRLSLDVLESVFQALEKNKLSKNDLQDVLFNLASGKSLEESLKVEKMSLDEVEEFIIKLIKQKPGLSMGGYMGLVMKEFKGKVNGKDLMDILKKHVK